MTVIFPNTCARSPWAAPISSSSRRPAPVDEWPDGLFEAELCTAAFQNGYFVALCNRVGVEDRLHFAGESFVCGPEGAVRVASAGR